MDQRTLICGNSRRRRNLTPRSARRSSSWTSGGGHGRTAVSGEIVLDRLIETLMTIALKHAGAQRGLLILLQGETARIEAEGSADQNTVEVTIRREAVTQADMPESLLHFVVRAARA